MDKEGQWQNGVRYGKGVFIYATGAQFNGEWSNNKKNGFGSFTSKDGRRYIGEFRNDRMVSEQLKSDIPFMFLMLEGEIFDENNKQINAVVSRYTSN
ncbi:hypothetical protein HK096_002692 [Nowakowskiella sp. JEL0078]|nr:hypothetical protein HK096_002692 [Nowakowskiella sp. JEL0078]